MTLMFNALKLGQSLQSPELWKEWQNVVNVFGGALPVLAIFYPPAQHLIDADFAGKFYALLGIINVYLTTATSDKVGF